MDARIFAVPTHVHDQLTNARLPVVMAFAMSIGNMFHKRDFPVGLARLGTPGIKVSVVLPPDTRKTMTTEGL